VQEGGEEDMPTFQYVQPTEEQKAIMQTFRDRYEALASQINTELPMQSSRCMSLALTKLEESAFWLNKAITHNE
jgi:hypothetical protein